jgi:hypothetical protein
LRLNLTHRGLEVVDLEYAKYHLCERIEEAETVVQYPENPPQNNDVVSFTETDAKACEVCGVAFHGWYDLGKKIQHYIDHGYRLLHVGTDTSEHEQGLWHTTIAVVGKKHAASIE